MAILIISLPYIQIALAVLIVAGVLLQQSETALGSTFGGADSGTSFHTRRGAEKFLFVGTIVVSILFVASCITALLLQ